MCEIDVEAATKDCDVAQKKYKETKALYEDCLDEKQRLETSCTRLTKAVALKDKKLQEMLAQVASNGSAVVSDCISHCLQDCYQDHLLSVE